MTSDAVPSTEVFVDNKRLMEAWAVLFESPSNPGKVTDSAKEKNNGSVSWPLAISKLPNPPVRVAVLRNKPAEPGINENGKGSGTKPPPTAVGPGSPVSRAPERDGPEKVTA
jgi:hypothetical protein